jgi:subtilisin-like proprotein convertase family protein
MYKHFILLVACFVGPFLSAQTFSSTVNEPIPDDGTIVSFSIEVSGLPDNIDTVFGLEQICFNITHPYVEDITLRLVAPDGKAVRLFGGVGGGGDDFINTCLAGSGTPLNAASPPYSGTFQSSGVMGDFNKGRNPNGAWTLVVEDTYAFADAGFLIDWSITFGNAPAFPFYFTSSNLPIVKLTTVADPIGDDPKVPVTMQIIDNGPGQRNYVDQTTYAFSGNIMAEWQGFSGVSLSKKNYDFEVVDALGEDLEVSLLGLPAESDWIFKAEYLDHTLLKNSLTYEMARRMGLYAPRTKPCEIILDGEYIGLYTLTEQVKRSKNRVDIARLRPEDLEGSELTGGYIFEMNINYNQPADWVSPHLPINYASNQLSVEFKYVYPRREVIAPEQANYLQNYVNEFENALLANNFDDPLAGFRAVADEQSFIDFLIVNEFSVNYDSYGRSTYLIKEKDTDGGKLRCGPPWDFDRAYGQEVLGAGWVWESTHPVWPYPFWWSRLWEDSSYRKRLACRWTMLRQNTLSDVQFLNAIDSLVQNISEGQARNFTVWNELRMPYEANVDTLRAFVLRRLHWIDATLAEQQVSPPDFYLPTDTTWIAGQVFDAAQIIGNQYTYNWQPGPDSSTIIFPADGLYTLLVTDTYGCFTRKSIQVSLQQSSVFDLNGNNLAGISVFPNPFPAQLNVAFEQAPRADFTLTLENETGQRVLSQAYPAGTTRASVSTANLPAGKYILRCLSAEKSWTTKLLKL